MNLYYLLPARLGCPPNLPLPSTVTSLQDKLSGGEMFSDAFEYKEVHGFFYEMEGKVRPLALALREKLPREDSADLGNIWRRASLARWFAGIRRWR